MPAELHDTGRSFVQNFQGRPNYRILPPVVAMLWIAGERGKPNLNADMASGTEATREPSDPNFEILGTNVASTCSAYGAEGGIVLTTTTGDNDQVLLCPHTDTDQSAWNTITYGTDRGSVFETIIQTGSSVASALLFAGLKLTNTPVIATDADQVFFRYSTDDSNTTWKVISSYNDTDTTTETGVTVEASTMYALRIEIPYESSTGDKYALCYINGVFVAKVRLRNAIDFKPFQGIQTLTTAAKSYTVFGIGCQRRPGASG